MGLATKLSIGFVGMAIDMIWYILVALLLTGTPLLEWLRNNGKAVNRTTAVVLWGFAISVVVSTVLAS